MIQKFRIDKNIVETITNGVFLVFILILFTLIGGYFGYKYKENQIVVSTKETSTFYSSSSAKNEIVPDVENPTPLKESSEVFFIKLNQPKQCPKEFSIKGTFNLDGGNFYTPDNKNYDRIKPDICFATEAFARDSASFIKKF